MCVRMTPVAVIQAARRYSGGERGGLGYVVSQRLTVA